MKFDVKNGMKFDVKKGFNKAGDAFNKAAENAKERAQKIADLVKDENAADPLAKKRPLFIKDYRSLGFSLPNVIVIVDHSVRNDDAAGRGSIGWKSIENRVEILYLYDDTLNSCGLHFIPVASCDSAYYVDPHNRTQFIKIDSYFERTQQSMLAELSNIAFCLGAKRYSVELVNKSEKIFSSSQKISGAFSGLIPAGPLKVGAGVKDSTQSEAGKQAHSLASAEFKRKRAPVVPELKWFAHDENITGLINTICVKRTAVKNFNFKFSGSDYSGMSKTTAANITGALLAYGIKLDMDIRKKAVEVNSREMVFYIEF